MPIKSGVSSVVEMMRAIIVDKFRKSMLVAERPSKKPWWLGQHQRFRASTDQESVLQYRHGRSGGRAKAQDDTSILLYSSNFTIGRILQNLVSDYGYASYLSNDLLDCLELIGECPTKFKCMIGVENGRSDLDSLVDTILGCDANPLSIPVLPLCVPQSFLHSEDGLPDYAALKVKMSDRLNGLFESIELRRGTSLLSEA